MKEIKTAVAGLEGRNRHRCRERTNVWTPREKVGGGRWWDELGDWD